MNLYSIYNLCLASIAVLALLLLRVFTQCWNDLLLAMRIAFLVTLISYPWDFFAIHMGAWQYPVHPGLKIHDVPANDLIFIWLCSILTSSFLIAVRRRKPFRQRDPEGKHATKEDARN
jgi:uncharacterized membrane protein YoaT (DUF817 family)